ncbi:MAG: hypothetical protein ACYTXY_51030, partial [Nostoc sp.]
MLKATSICNTGDKAGWAVVVAVNVPGESTVGGLLLLLLDRNHRELFVSSGLLLELKVLSGNEVIFP